MFCLLHLSKNLESPVLLKTSCVYLNVFFLLCFFPVILRANITQILLSNTLTHPNSTNAL